MIRRERWGQGECSRGILFESPRTISSRSTIKLVYLLVGLQLIYSRQWRPFIVTLLHLQTLSTWAQPKTVCQMQWLLTALGHLLTRASLQCIKVHISEDYVWQDNTIHTLLDESPIIIEGNDASFKLEDTCRHWKSGLHFRFWHDGDELTYRLSVIVRWWLTLSAS